MSTNKVISQTKLRDLIIKKGKGRSATLANSYYDRIINLLANAIKIECTDSNIEFGFTDETFVKRGLIEGGKAGYSKVAQKWFYVAGENVNRLGYPTDLTLWGLNGTTFQAKASYDKNEFGSYIIYASPYPYSAGSYIYEVCKVLGECDLSALQNIQATKTPAIFVCSSDEIRLSVEQAIQQIQEGKPVLVTSTELSDAIKGIDTKTEYIADRVELYKRQRLDALLNELGVLTSVDKAERVQSAEVNASIGECKDYISIWTDTFNKQMQSYDLPFVMKINNALEEIYKPIEDMDKGIDQIDVKEEIKDDI